MSIMFGCVVVGILGDVIVSGGVGILGDVVVSGVVGILGEW